MRLTFPSAAIKRGRRARACNGHFNPALPSILPSLPLAVFSLYREIERPISARDDHDDDGSRDRGGCEDDGQESGARSPRKNPAADSGRVETGAFERDTPPSGRHGAAASSSSAYGSEKDGIGFDYDDDDDGVDSSADDDERGAFGSGNSGSSERGSYRGDDSDGEHGGGGDGGRDGKEEGGSVESLALSANSSDWTPLLGAGFVSPLSRQDRSGDWFSQPAPRGKVCQGVIVDCRVE